MARITIRDKTIESSGNRAYVIAEIGCNHNGDFGLALQMIRAAAECGADAVKFQKRSPQKLFTPEALAAPYDSPNSHGKTYGEHRQALDWFGYSEFYKIKETCHENDVAFICTPFTQWDADFLSDDEIEPDAYKIASCDLNNTPLISQIAWYGMPMIISTGGGTMADIDLAMACVTDQIQVALLHCVSTYPNEDKDLNLKKIKRFIDGPHNAVIGFSSHHPGLLPHYLAYQMGARIFEVHFTLNRGSKGTDHGFSLEPTGLRKLCHDLKRIPDMLGSATAPILDAEKNGFIRKMGKCVYAARDLPANTIISKEDVVLLSPAVIGAMRPNRITHLIGRKTIGSIREFTPLLETMFFGE